MKITLRLCTRRDVGSCARIVGSNYSRAYEKSSRCEIASMFSNSAVTPVYWVATANGKVIGFAGYIQSWLDYGVYQIFWVNVDPTMQQQGVGRRLMRKLVSEIKKKKGVHLIQISVTKRNAVYYRRHFKFKTLVRINDAPEYIMYLRVR